MSERAPVSPEVVTPNEALAALHDAHRLIAGGGYDRPDPESTVAGQRTQFWAVMDRAKKCAPSNDESLLLGAYAEALDYIWYGDAHARVPGDVINDAGADKGPYGRYRLSPNILTSGAVSSAQAFLKTMGFDEIMQVRADVVNHLSRPELVEPAKTFIKQSKAYAFLESFLIEAQPPNKDRPLSAIEKAHLVSRLGAETVRTMHGAHPTAVRRALATIDYRVDDATARQPRRSEAVEPEDNAAKFRQAVINEAARYARDELGIDDPQADTQAGSWIIYFKGTFENVHVANLFPQHRTDELPILAESGSILLSSMMRAVTGVTDPVDYAAVLERELEDEASLLLKQLFAMGAPGTVSEINQHLTALKSPHFAFFQPMPSKDSSRMAEDWRPEFQKPISMLSAAEMERQKAIRAATIVKAPPNDSMGRMMIPIDMPVLGIRPVVPAEADLIIQAEPWMLEDSPAYQVPGYRLIAADETGRFGYVYEAHNDPYARNERPMQPQEIAKFADVAEGSLMGNLAREIRTAEGLTVADAIDVLREHQTYVKPFKAGLARRAPSSAYELRDFVNQHTMRYEVQCDYAGAIGNVYVNNSEIGWSGPRIGHPFRPNGDPVITALQHRQTFFIDRVTGKQHILDATPSTEAGVMDWEPVPIPGQRRFSLKNVVRWASRARENRELRKQPWDAVPEPEASRLIEQGEAPVADVHIPEQRKAPSTKLTEADIKSELEKNRTSLIDQLGIALGSKDAPLPPSMLLDSVRRRPTTDLTRLALEVVEMTLPFQGHPADKPHVSRGRAEYLLGYIEALRTNPESVRDPHNYASRVNLLKTLETSLRRVVKLTTPQQ